MITNGGEAGGDSRAGDCTCGASAEPLVGATANGADPANGGNGKEGTWPKSSSAGIVSLAVAGAACTKGNCARETGTSVGGKRRRRCSSLSSKVSVVGSSGIGGTPNGNVGGAGTMGGGHLGVFLSGIGPSGGGSVTAEMGFSFPSRRRRATCATGVTSAGRGVARRGRNRVKISLAEVGIDSAGSEREAKGKSSSDRCRLGVDLAKVDVGGTTTLEGNRRGSFLVLGGDGGGVGTLGFLGIRPGGNGGNMGISAKVFGFTDGRGCLRAEVGGARDLLDAIRLTGPLTLRWRWVLVRNREVSEAPVAGGSNATAFKSRSC